MCDADADRAHEAAQKFGGKVYVDYRDMIEKEEIEAVFVCVPPFAHKDAEALAAEKGLHIFVEKPVVLELEQGLEIKEAIEKAGVISCVGYQVRYLPVASAAREFLKGRPVALVAGHRWAEFAGGPGHWWRRMDRSGGMLHEQATHNVDLIRYVVGEVGSVYARYSSGVLRDVENLTVPDAQVVVMEFRNGATGYFSTACTFTKDGWWNSTDVILRDMMLRMTFSDVAILPEGAAEVPVPEPGMSIQEAFIHAVRTGDRSVIRSDYADALKTTELTLAANESAKTGRPIEMRLS